VRPSLLNGGSDPRFQEPIEKPLMGLPDLHQTILIARLKSRTTCLIHPQRGLIRGLVGVGSREGCIHRALCQDRMRHLRTHRDRP
jgi:hypothetical protein